MIGKPGHYYCKAQNGHISVYQILKVNEKLMHNKSGEIKEVLSPCDYEEMQRLKKENDNLSALITSGELEIGYLRTLLKECKPYIQKEMETIKGANFCNCDWAWKTSDLLTRINAALGESEK